MIGFSCHRGQSGDLVTVWALLCAIPLLLAAELVQRPHAPIQLLAQEAYRSNLSERALKSSSWRQSNPESRDWRTPASPTIEWRTDKTFGPPQSRERQHVELYQEYRPGEASTFDLSTREDHSLFKIFEFDLGR